MAYLVRKCAAFLAPSGSMADAEKLHLHVVSTEPCSNDKCLLLTISTIREGVWFDNTRTIEIGAHDFIAARSFVSYRHAVVKNCSTIRKSVDGWVYMVKKDFDNALTDSIVSGVRESDMTPRYVIDYLDSLEI